MYQRLRPTFVCRRLPLLACIVASLSATSGCYKHVIRVEGPGSDAYDIYEPNYKPEEDPFVKKPKTEADKVPSQMYRE